jgi:hypothetical protein
VRKLIAAATTTALAVGLVVVASSGPVAGQTTRTISVSPATDLVNRQEVQVSGSGFSTDNAVMVCQALRTPSPSMADCTAEAAGVGLDETGTFTLDFSIQRYLVLTNSLPYADCAAPDADCVILAADLIDPSQVASFPIDLRDQAGPPDFAIQGRVRDGDRNPIAGAPVWAFTDTDTWVGSMQTTTAADGTFRFDDPQIFRGYQIAVGSPPGAGFAHGWAASSSGVGPSRFPFPFETRLYFNDPVAGFDLELPAAGIVSGRVEDAAGQPVAGAVVRGYLPTDRLVGTYAAVTGADGSFSIDWLLPGHNVVIVAQAPAGSGLLHQWYDEASGRSSGDLVTITEGDEVDLGTIVLRSAAGPVRRL